MSRNLVWLFSIVLLILFLAGNALAAEDPSLVIYYDFEGFGNDSQVLDKSGYSHDAAVVKDVTGLAGAGVRNSEACKITGEGSYLDLDGMNFPAEDIPTTAFTLAYWVKPEDTGGTQTVFSALAAPHSWCHGGYIRNDQYHAHLGDINNNYIINAYEGTVEYDAWHHMALTWELVPGEYGGGAMYIDGELVAEYGNDFVEAPPGVEAADNWGGGTRIGRDVDDSWQFNGLLDDFFMFRRALSQDEVRKLMEGMGSPTAYGPTPPNGSLLLDTWVTLGWYAGDNAVTHDVYMGDNYDDVFNSTGDTFRGNQNLTFYVAGFPGYAYPDGLVPGTTYYWRIDEVNQAEPNSPWKGDIWSFTVPPKTAYNPIPSDGAEFVDPNVTFSWTPGFGAKLHTVYVGDDFDQVNNAEGGASQGPVTYSPGTLESGKVYYWRVDEFDAAGTYKGDVWSFTTPGAVASPVPASGAVDVKMTATLSWTPAENAVSHEVYFGTDKDAVRNADQNSPEYKGDKALGDENYDPGKLDWYSTYCWRVDEIDSLGNTSKGPLWSFTTADFISVDDFEDYDAGENQIWYAWLDGLGFGTPDTPPYSPGNGTGSAVGDENTPSYCEESIVHGGGKSMPVAYNNNKQGYAFYSEVAKTLSYPRNWTEQGVGILTLWLKGRTDNSAEPLYVGIANSGGEPAVVIHDDPAASQVGVWMKWEIPLSAFADQGIDLSDVDKIAIGVGTHGNTTVPGGSGRMYIDDIRLYQPSEIAE
ncbi:MAG TPA: hypothetical protein DIU00_02285 [Phycisphaerales bacterium]|nr:hypothetical protein [Phycisphaerales bacterium]